MSNNDKFIRDTLFGKLMESKEHLDCEKCKFYTLPFHECRKATESICLQDVRYYFAKDETDETEKV